MGFARLYWVLLGFTVGCRWFSWLQMDQTGFYRVSLDLEWVTKGTDSFQHFSTGSNGFCTVVLGCTGFYCGLQVVFLVANESNGFLPSFTRFGMGYKGKRSISLVFKGFKWVLHGFTGFYWVFY